MRNRRNDWLPTGVIAALCYIPLFLTRVGQVAADTKQYLYLDPARLTAGAGSMWDPSTGLGTVTHQNIGYLLPMGPYYSAAAWLGVPVWVAQRFWMGSLLLAAATGVAYCARRLGLEGPGRWVAAGAYAFSPYILDYLDRTSAILMPWAALGWMVGLVAVAARTGRWRPAALFALVVALVGGVNATSILLVLVAPALWLAYAVWGTREVSLGRAVGAAARLGVLSVLVSLWWAAGLWAEGRYGIDVLRVTETVPTVSKTSSAAEVLRGLGYWYFYGWDKVQPWTLQAVPYTQSPWLLGLSLVLPASALALGLLARWAYRGFCLGLVGVGVVVAVGAFPFGHPSWFGSVVKAASAGSTVALAMRSVDRIVPVVLLGLALMMGAGVTALYRRVPAGGLAAAGLCAAMVGADLPALWTGGLVASNLGRPSALPAYWHQAAAYLNASGDSSRVLGLPGEDFAAYSWGVTEDPVPPGLLERPYVSRSIVPTGTPPSANLLQALDEPLQEGTMYLPALAPVARLMSVGSVLLQSDLQFERYHLPFPQVLYAQIASPAAGLGPPVPFGAPDPARPIRYQLYTEARLGIPTGTPEPPALTVFPVSDPRPLVRAEPAAAPLVVAGDGAGVVEAAGAGLLGGDQPVLYAAGGGAWPGATLVLTDSNPLADYQWGSLQANIGEVRQPGVADLAANPSYYALPVFPSETAADQTVAVVGGLASVQATSYGDPLTLTPESKPLNAFDGDPSTAWAFGAHEPVAGIRLQARLLGPVTADHVVLHQLAQVGQAKRQITAVTLTFDGGHPRRVSLTAASLSPGGQTVNFPPTTFSDFGLVVDGATGGADRRYDGLPSVGFTEISIPGVPPATETLRLPTDLPAGSLGDAFDILVQRRRVSGPPRSDPEPEMSRTFYLPAARTFTVAGTAEVNAGDSDYLIDQLIGLIPPPPTAPGTGAEIVAANSSTRLDGDRSARANAAVDGNPATAWIAETGPQAGEWLGVTLSRPVSFDHLDLQVLNDGRHSLPTRITVSTPAASRTVDLVVPPTGYGRPANATSPVTVTFPALTGSAVRVTIDAVRPVRTLDYYSTFAPVTDILPVGIAELGLPGVVQPAAPPAVPAACSTGLVAVDGTPVPVEVAGPTSAALGGGQLLLHGCGSAAGGVELAAGWHTVTTAPRLPSGWSVDQLWWSSAPGGGPGPALGPSPPAPPPGGAGVKVSDLSRTSLTAAVPGTGAAQWLVLGQSYSDGWSAVVGGGRSLGAPRLVDGFANGWLLPPSPPGTELVVHLEWRPQRVVDAALAASAAALIACLLLVLWPARRRIPAVPLPVGPEPARWGGSGGPAAPWAAGLLAAVGWGVLAAAASRPALGAAGAGALVVAARWPAGRVLCRAGAVCALAGLIVYELAEQARHHYWPDINWPSNLVHANDLAWLGLVLLGSDLLAGALRARRPAPYTLDRG